MLRDAISDAWAVISPVQCAGCGADDRALCPSCRTALAQTPTVRRVGDTHVHSALVYSAVVRELFIAFKQHGRTDVAAALAAPLTRALDAAIAAAARRPGVDRIEFALVPTSAAAWRRRGYDPVRLLVSRAGFSPRRILRSTRSRAVQKSLGVAERARNLAGAFVARGDLSGRHFIVIDDILTSGATIAEAVRAVRAAHGDVVGAATIAFTPRLTGTRDNDGNEDYRGQKGAH
jgi:predicted amidophosphoribosyltransferase